MDETDLILSMLLLFNSRTPYRVLAENLGLSVNAVHKRIHSMVEQGVIRRFTTRISLPSLGAFHVLINGRSEAESTYSIWDDLGNHESVYWVTLAGGNYVYVGAHLRDIQELPELVKHVGEAGRMPDAKVGIIHEAFSGKGRSLDELIDPLDWEIVRSLSHDSRKATSSIAEEVGASTRTVRRRLTRLVDEGLLDFSIDWYPSASNDINTMVHLELGTASAEKVIERYMAEYRPNALYAWRFSNFPGQVVGLLWAPSMNKLRELTERMAGDEDLCCTTPVILYAGKLYETWRDRLVIEKSSPPKGGF